MLIDIHRRLVQRVMSSRQAGSDEEEKMRMIDKIIV